MSDPSLSRRELLAAGAIATGYALAVRPVEAAAITTDTAGLVVGSVKIPTKDGEIEAYRARPAHGGPSPLVLVVHEIFGVHEYVRDLCRRLAHAGYAAVAPDLYQRHGNVLEVSDVHEIIGKVVAKVRDDQVLSDLDATVAWARASSEVDAGRRAITGFCWGGRAGASCGCTPRTIRNSTRASPGTAASWATHAPRRRNTRSNWRNRSRYRCSDCTAGATGASPSTASNR